MKALGLILLFLFPTIALSEMKVIKAADANFRVRFS